MARLITVLVTGAGALLGQGILRALRLTDRAVRIVSADPDPRASGHWLGDVAVTIPLARDPAYLPRMEQIIAREKVDVLLVGTDVELGVLAGARPRLEREHGVRVVVSPPDAVEIADDKLLTARFLGEHGFPAPRSALASDGHAVRRLAEEAGLPLFVKPRRGARSVGAHVVETAAALARACAEESSLVVQELLPGAEGEFTAGALVFGGTCQAVVVLRRDLKDGNTYRAYRDPSCARFDPFVARVAEAIGAHGPCNLQFRLRGGDPVVFEINARFSGTTPVRAVFGFNEVGAVLDHLLDGIPVRPPHLRDGVVLRTTGDLLVEDAQIEQLRTEGRLTAARADELPFVVPRRCPG